MGKGIHAGRVGSLPENLKRASTNGSILREEIRLLWTGTNMATMYSLQ